MAEQLIVRLIIGIGIGVLFYITEYYQERYCMKCRLDDRGDIYISIVAGISVAYFFLELLPIIVDFLNPFLELLTFLFIMAGFTVVYLVEKYILQRVEVKTRKKVSELDKLRKSLKNEEANIRTVIEKEIIDEEWNKATLRSFAEQAFEKHKRDIKLKSQEKQLKLKIEEHLNKDLDEVHAATTFFYHTAVGMILFSLLYIDFIAALFFFIFAYLKSTIVNTSNRHVEFAGLDVHMGAEEHPLEKILPISVLLGVVLGFFFELFYPIPVTLVFTLLAFISGTILYIMVREVIPEKTKGKPSYFLLGLVGFSLAIIVVYILELSIH